MVKGCCVFVWSGVLLTLSSVCCLVLFGVLCGHGAWSVR